MSIRGQACSPSKVTGRPREARCFAWFSYAIVRRAFSNDASPTSVNAMVRSKNLPPISRQAWAAPFQAPATWRKLSIFATATKWRSHRISIVDGDEACFDVRSRFHAERTMISLDDRRLRQFCREGRRIVAVPRSSSLLRWSCTWHSISTRYSAPSRYFRATTPEHQ